MQTPVFSDITILGEVGKTQKIPARTMSFEQSSPSDQAHSHLENTIRCVHPRNSDDKFLDDMKKFVDISGQPVPFVPFKQHWPTYDSMDHNQRAWYFYWRSQVRFGQCPDTDLSYIFVYIYELLSGCGWECPSGGYMQLMFLWMSYRDRFPKLDRYLYSWIFDFLRVHQLSYTIPHMVSLQLPTQPEMRNILIEQHSKDSPLKLPFFLICSLCNYSITGSKFYKEGHQQLIQEAIPRIISLTDAVLIKEKQQGILSIYGPDCPTRQRHYMFYSAICPNANKYADFSVKEYSSNANLRNYITQLVRFSENVLRSLYHYRGQLRDIELDPNLSNIIEMFLKREYTPQKQVDEKQSKMVELTLDFDRIEDLRMQSEFVRNALEVVDEDDQTNIVVEDYTTDHSTSSHKSVQTTTIQDEPYNPELCYTDSTEALHQFVGALSDTQKQALNAILFLADPQDKLTQLAERTMSMPEIIIDEINEIATQFLDDILIDTFDNIPTVLEQYISQLRCVTELLEG